MSAMHPSDRYITGEVTMIDDVVTYDYNAVSSWGYNPRSSTWGATIALFDGIAATIKRIIPGHTLPIIWIGVDFGNGQIVNGLTPEWFSLKNRGPSVQTTQYNNNFMTGGSQPGGVLQRDPVIKIEDAERALYPQNFKSKSNQVCVCTMTTLMRAGCECGVVTKYKPKGMA